jgi:hypothetical protein
MARLCRGFVSASRPACFVGINGNGNGSGAEGRGWGGKHPAPAPESSETGMVGVGLMPIHQDVLFVRCLARSHRLVGRGKKRQRGARGQRGRGGGGQGGPVPRKQAVAAGSPSGAAGGIVAGVARLSASAALSQASAHVSSPAGLARVNKFHAQLEELQAARALQSTQLRMSLEDGARVRADLAEVRAERNILKEALASMEANSRALADQHQFEVADLRAQVARQTQLFQRQKAAWDRLMGWLTVEHGATPSRVANLPPADLVLWDNVPQAK